MSHPDGTVSSPAASFQIVEFSTGNDSSSKTRKKHPYGIIYYYYESEAKAIKTVYECRCIFEDYKLSGLRASHTRKATFQDRSQVSNL